MRISGRRWFEVGSWLAIIAISDLVTATSVLIEYARLGVAVQNWEPFVWEFTSGVMILALVPLIIVLDHRFPFVPGGFARAFFAHLLATIPYSILHVAGMVGLRKAIYTSADRVYDFGNVPLEAFYEYRKDVLGYAFILLVVYAYRHIAARWLGWAESVSSAGDDTSSEARFRIRKRGRDFIISEDQIDWVEAAGNYAFLHVGDKVFPLRSTMGELETRLTNPRLARVHRSAIVNLDRIGEIRPTGAGDYLLVLDDGAEVRASRRYGKQLREIVPR